MAYAVERRSEHALARAVGEEAEALGLDARYPAAGDVRALPGRGVEGVVNGRNILIGSHRFFDSSVDHAADLCDTLNGAAQQGQTPMLLRVGESYSGYILVADTVRPESRDVVQQLHEMGIETTVLITGDDVGAASYVADQVGISDVVAGVLPAQKVEAVESLKQRTEGAVAMVGDGVNDAPALAAADVGIAMGEGTAQALETADAVLMANGLNKLPLVLKLGRAAMRTIWFNIAFSIGLKAIVFVLVLTGSASMWAAVLADVGASLIVTLNGMRLLKFTGE
jgi:Cd2+/Zn2+-exporting ATPase